MACLNSLGKTTQFKPLLLKIGRYQKQIDIYTNHLGGHSLRIMNYENYDSRFEF